MNIKLYWLEREEFEARACFVDDNGQSLNKCYNVFNAEEFIREWENDKNTPQYNGPYIENYLCASLNYWRKQIIEIAAMPEGPERTQKLKELAEDADRPILIA